MTKRELSNNGLLLIKSFEGCKLKAYKVSPNDKYYTIGYGHYGADVAKDMVLTQAKADALLKKDCYRFVEHVNTYMSIYDFTQNQFDALVSFAYNVGNIAGLTKNGKRSIPEISNKMLEYCKSNGKTLTGLVTRRKKEKELFDTTSNDKTITDIAREVIAGKWGNGEERKRKLVNSGYDYARVQKEVNKLLKKGGE